MNGGQQKRAKMSDSPQSTQRRATRTHNHWCCTCNLYTLPSVREGYIYQIYIYTICSLNCQNMMKKRVKRDFVNQFSKPLSISANRVLLSRCCSLANLPLVFSVTCFFFLPPAQPFCILAACALISENWKNPHSTCKIITKIFPNVDRPNERIDSESRGCTRWEGGLKACSIERLNCAAVESTALSGHLQHFWPFGCWGLSREMRPNQIWETERTHKKMKNS